MRRRDLARLAIPAACTAAFPAEAKKRVAGIVTEYRFWSHADVILGRILGGYSANNVHTEPRTRLVSLYTDQVPPNDMSRDLAARHGFRICTTIREALTSGGGKLAVDAVVFVGEHGNYPFNELGQHLYPRYELFNQVLDVFEQGGQPVPAFFDKHLSYSWEKAKAIYERAKKLRVPWFAGSSIPVTIRHPMLEIPLGTPLEHAVVAGYGPHDAYGFHLLEALECMVERRAGGETGIASVEWIEGDALWQWLAGDGKWARPLLDEAVRRNPSRKPVPVEEEARTPVLFVLQYKDGFRAAGFILGPSGSQWSFACRRKGAAQKLAQAGPASIPVRNPPAAGRPGALCERVPQKLAQAGPASIPVRNPPAAGRPGALCERVPQMDSTFFGLAKPGRPLPHFDGLVKCIEDLFVTGKPPYPVERTLLTTGALSFLFESKRRGRRVETPELAITYRAPEHAFFQRS
ncbi:MAG: hypothetical protein HY235_25450 [Acidobacteria bacterium]|nr:hypothetical protein [Acidobacteriota bacterium]